MDSWLNIVKGDSRFRKVDRKLKGVVIYKEDEDNMMIKHPRKARLRGTLGNITRLMDRDGGYYMVAAHIEPGEVTKPYFIRDGAIDIPLDTSIAAYHDEQYLKLELIRVADHGERAADVGTSNGISVVCRGRIRLPDVYDVKMRDEKVVLVKCLEGQCSLHGDLFVTLEKQTLVSRHQREREHKLKSSLFGLGHCPHTVRILSLFL